MVADWFEARQRGERPIMLALRRRDVEELNALARALLVEQGAVAGDGVTVGGLPFAAGDRVVCLHNDRRVGVHNAMFGTIEGHDDESLMVKVDGAEHRLRIPRSYAADGHLVHAYATTIHKAQGATYERALMLGDDRLYRQAGYTGLSRGKHRNDIYPTVRRTGLRAARRGCGCRRLPASVGRAAWQAARRRALQLNDGHEAGRSRSPAACAGHARRPHLKETPIRSWCGAPRTPRT